MLKVERVSTPVRFSLRVPFSSTSRTAFKYTSTWILQRRASALSRLLDRLCFLGFRFLCFDVRFAAARNGLHFERQVILAPQLDQPFFDRFRVTHDENARGVGLQIRAGHPLHVLARDLFDAHWQAGVFI